MVSPNITLSDMFFLSAECGSPDYSNVSLYRRQMSDPYKVYQIIFVLYLNPSGERLYWIREAALISGGFVGRACLLQRCEREEHGHFKFWNTKRFCISSHYCSVPSYAGNQRKTSLLRTWHSTILTWLDTDGNRNGLLQWGKFHINALQSVHKGFEH